ncbi:hypothetical protein ACKVEX_12490 [Rhodocyclaceae bacterium SMB388]
MKRKTKHALQARDDKAAREFIARIRREAMIVSISAELTARAAIRRAWVTPK